MLGVNDLSSGILAIYGKSGKRLAALSAGASTGQLALFDSNDKPLFEQP